MAAHDPHVRGADRVREVFPPSMVIAIDPGESNAGGSAVWQYDLFGTDWHPTRGTAHGSGGQNTHEQVTK